MRYDVLMGTINNVHVRGEEPYECVESCIQEVAADSKRCAISFAIDSKLQFYYDGGYKLLELHDSHFVVERYDRKAECFFIVCDKGELQQKSKA